MPSSYKIKANIDSLTIEFEGQKIVLNKEQALQLQTVLNKTWVSGHPITEVAYGNPWTNTTYHKGQLHN